MLIASYEERRFALPVRGDRACSAPLAVPRQACLPLLLARGLGVRLTLSPAARSRGVQSGGSITYRSSTARLGQETNEEAAT